jgi:microcystin-dependent protein
MPTPYLGELKLAAFNFAPKGWALCNGQVLSIAQNQALFSLLGTQYGGTVGPPLLCPTCRARSRSASGPPTLRVREAESSWCSLRSCRCRSIPIPR